MIKAAVIGCGNISRVHLRVLSGIHDVKIVGVADIKPERAGAGAEEYGTKAYSSLAELLKAEEPDCVHICTPHYLHTPMAVEALEAGANVFVEKPCSVTAEEAGRLLSAQRKSGRQLGVCFQNRYNSCVRYVKDVVDSGEFGSVKAIRAFVTWSRGADYYSDDWHGTLDKECGGVLINQAIHTVDLIQYLGGGCESLTAHTANDHLRGVIEVEDNACVLMRLGCGATGLLYATTAYAENSGVLLEVLFERGKLRFEGDRLFSVDEKGGIAEISVPASEVCHGKKYWGAGHTQIINDFYDCLRTGRVFDIDALEGGRAARIVAACYESSASGESVEVG